MLVCQLLINMPRNYLRLLSGGLPVSSMDLDIWLKEGSFELIPIGIGVTVSSCDVEFPEQIVLSKKQIYWVNEGWTKGRLTPTLELSIKGKEKKISNSSHRLQACWLARECRMWNTLSSVYRLPVTDCRKKLLILLNKSLIDFVGTHKQEVC